MGDGVGVGKGTGRKAAWEWARVSGESVGRQAYRRFSLFFALVFFSLRTGILEIYHTVSLEIMKR